MLKGLNVNVIYCLQFVCSESRGNMCFKLIYPISATQLFTVLLFFYLKIKFPGALKF